MRKIILIAVLALSAFTFSGCEWICKKCPECPENRPSSTTKTLNYYVYIIDTLKPNSPFEKYTVQFNDQSPQVIVPGQSFNISYNPSTETDSVLVRVDAIKTNGNQVRMALYKMPLYWEESNVNDTLFKTQIFYNPNEFVAGGPPTPGTGLPDPVCQRRCRL